MTLHDRHREWILARGISGEVIDRMKLFTANDDGKNWLAVPYVEAGTTVNHKYRLTGEKRHKMDTDAPLTLWNYDCLTEDEVFMGDRPVILTEGEWDAMAAMTVGYRHVVSVPNGAPQKAVDAEIGPETDAERFRFLWRAKGLLDQVKTFILATDDDEPGRILAAELARRLGPERCRFVTYPHGCKDLNEILLRHDANALRAAVDGAKPYPIKSLYRLSDFPEPPAIDAEPLGIQGLSDAMPLVRRAFTVVTGFAGAGKTSLICSVVAAQIKAGKSVAMGSFETLPKPYLQRKLRAGIIGCNEHSLPVTRIGEADRMIDRHFTLIANNADEDSEMDLDELIELCRVAVLRDGVSLIIIDPWNEIEHKRRGDENDHEYTGRAIRKLKRFMHDYDVSLWVVVHPRKPDLVAGKGRMPSLYDASGSAHWANKADYGLVLWRPDKSSNEVEAHVTKVRMGYPGKERMVKLAYDFRFSEYTEVVSALAEAA